jgi:hypothetical protein
MVWLWAPLSTVGCEAGFQVVVTGSGRSRGLVS